MESNFFLSSTLINPGVVYVTILYLVSGGVAQFPSDLKYLLVSELEPNILNKSFFENVTEVYSPLEFIIICSLILIQLPLTLIYWEYPFSVGITKDGVKNPVTFIEDTGYNIAVLKSLLYVLAATEPGTFYFGAIRETDKTVIPEIKVFNQNVVFMPYFNSDGSFNCYVFMNGRELTLEDFCMIYGSDFVYLTKVKSSREFFPQWFGLNYEIKIIYYSFAF